jgi:hypothetical protein
MRPVACRCSSDETCRRSPSPRSASGRGSP